MQINLKNIVLFCCFVVFSQHLFALQLGDIKVNSTQDQKLNASIKLTLSDNESLDDLNPSVASKEAYISRSIDRFDIHSDIKMIIKNRLICSPDVRKYKIAITEINVKPSVPSIPSK